MAGTTGLTPLVGREHEVGLLQERWAQSRDGLGQVVLLSGEAGIGKSAWCVLTERVADEGVPWLTLRCSPYHTNSAFYPVIEHLQRLLQWDRHETPAARLDTLEQGLRTTGLPLEDIVPLLAALLSLPVPEQYPPLTLSPQRQKQKTQEALVAWLLAETARQPVLAVWEDLHWADPSTLELLDLLLDHVPTARLLLVLTSRPEFRPPWAPRSYVTQLTLPRMPRRQSEEMVLRVTGGKPVPAEVLAQIVAKTDGIPLFIEELVKTILAAGLVQEDTGRYVLTGPLPPGDSNHVAGRADGSAGPVGGGERGGAARGGPGAGVFIRAAAGGSAAGRGNVAAGAGSAHGGRNALSTGAATACDLCL